MNASSSLSFILIFFKSKNYHLYKDLLSHCLMKSPEHDGYAKYEDICDSIGKKPTCTTLNSIEEIEPCDEMRI